MKPRPGQAASGIILRRLLGGLLALLVAALIGLSALALRLGDRPLPLPPLAHALERAASAELGGGSLEIGEAALAWQGWREGAAAPLDFRLSGLKLRDGDGSVRAELPEAAVTLSVRALLRGVLAFDTIDLRRPRVTVVRTAEGVLNLGLGPPPPPTATPSAPDAPAEALELLRVLARPPSDDGTFTALRRIRLLGGEISVTDLATDRTWALLDPRIDIRRADMGGLLADGAATISSGEFSAPVRLHGAVSGRPTSITLGVSLPALHPEQLAAVWPAIGPVSALESRVSLSASADFDAWGRPERIEARVAAEAGRLRLGPGHYLPFAALTARAETEGRGAPIRLADARLAFPPSDAGPGAVLTGSGEAALRGGAWDASLDFRAETLPAAALDRAWPEELEPKLRRAVLGAMPSGTLEGGRLALSLRASETLGEVELVEARAALEARDAVFALGAGGRVAVAAADVVASFRPDGLRVERLSARLPGVPGAAAGPTVVARGAAERHGPGWLARVELSLDAVRFADLGSYWPENLAPNVRRWLVQNVTAGEARSGFWRIDAELPEALDAVRVSALSGRAEATGATIHWLRPIPPVLGVSGVAEFSLDTVSIAARSGRQARADNSGGGGGGRGGIEAREGSIRFIGLDAGPGEADIALQLAGPLADAVALIKHPRLKLFERKPLQLDVAAGQAEARLRIGFPLLADIPVERLRFNTTARINDAHLRGALLGHDVQDGRVELSADLEGMRVGGEAVLVGAPVRLNLEFDFRPGPPTQVQERATLTGRADPRQIALFGLDTGGLLEGMTAVEARYERRRNGAGAVALRGDLRDARLLFNPAGWEKPPGEPGAAEAVLRLQGDALLSADAMRLDAADLSLRNGRAQFSAGGKRLEQVEIAEARFGAVALRRNRAAPARRRHAGGRCLAGDAARPGARPAAFPLLRPGAGEAWPPSLMERTARFPSPSTAASTACWPAKRASSRAWWAVPGSTPRACCAPPRANGRTAGTPNNGGGALRPLALARRRAAARAARLGGGWRRLPARHRREDDQRRAAHGERRL